MRKLTKNEAIEKLKRQLDLIGEIRSSQYGSPEFKKWRQDTTTAIVYIFEENSRQFREFAGISFYSVSMGTGPREDLFQQGKFREGLDSADAVLKSLIDEVKDYWQDEPTDPEAQHSITDLIRVLRRFRECCQYLKSPPKREAEVQDIVWIMLRSHFDRLDREDTLPRFGVKNYKPDFGVPDLRTLVEVKFVGEKTKVGEDIQESILGDIPGYLNQHSKYDNLIVLVYDAAHKLRDPRKFIEDLRSADGIIEVFIIAGIG